VTSMYHDGQRVLQDAFDGRRVADVLEDRRKRSTFDDDDVAMIHAAPFFFLATAHDGVADCSFKGGAPGFVRVTGPDSLEWPDHDGNSMYRSLGNILLSPAVGLLFMTFDGAPARLRVNGQAEILRDPEILARHHAARAVVRVTAQAIFPNCARYIPDLTHGTPSEYTPHPGVTPPQPAWKSRDYIRGILPVDDPARDV
jgi:predicted pyridoxine 5'-phosphate oxidase superfamily flavin-nucleotide-binding protein